MEISAVLDIIFYAINISMALLSYRWTTQQDQLKSEMEAKVAKGDPHEKMVARVDYLHHMNELTRFYSLIFGVTMGFDACYILVWFLQ